MSGVELELDGRRVSLSSLERVLWPAAAFTKRDLVDYYRAVAPAILPHLAGRALTLARFPGGVEERGFGQTECRGAPPWLATRTLQLRGGAARRYCVVEDEASLVWIANLNTVELHTFAAAGTRPDEAAAVVFDLDPGSPAGILECCEVALSLRELLAADGLAGVVKTTGSIGLHVHVPLNSPHGFGATKAYARSLAGRLASERPELVTDRTPTAGRAGKVLVDWLQNDPARTLVAPYSLRATAFPTVSTPVAWEEVERAVAAGRPELIVFLAGDVVERVRRLGDPFRPALELEQRLPG